MAMRITPIAANMHRKRERSETTRLENAESPMMIPGMTETMLATKKMTKAKKPREYSLPSSLPRRRAGMG